MSTTRRGNDTRAIERTVKEAAGRGLRDGGEHVLNVSNQHVPIEESTLEKSGRVSQQGLKVAVSYDTPYAAVQHEDLTLRHDPGRNAKFLENAGNSEADKVRRLIADRIRSALH